MVSALGVGKEDSAARLFSGALPATTSRTLTDGRRVPVLAIWESSTIIPPALKPFDCRNNRIAAMTLAQIREAVERALSQFGPDRVGVVVGSSTSSLEATERAVRAFAQSGVHPPDYHFDRQHAMGALSSFLAARSGARGPAYTVSTACSSAAKALLCAKGLIETGICDAVISGGVDTLCDLTVNGFAALGQVSDERTNPMSAHRRGLNIGEGGALFLLSREDGPLSLAGGGESMDAHHMSAPHPEGRGAAMAMAAALADAGIAAGDVGCINLHGTGTKANDAMESLAVSGIFGDVPCSSTKPFTGHCLGASGAVEAAICAISLQDGKGRLPPHVWDGVVDPQIAPLHLITPGETWQQTGSTAYMLSNSFAFGGNNCALVLRREGGLP